MDYNPYQTPQSTAPGAIVQSEGALYRKKRYLLVPAIKEIHLPAQCIYCGHEITMHNRREKLIWRTQKTRVMMTVCAIEALFGLPFSTPLSLLLLSFGLNEVASLVWAIRLIALILALVLMIFARNKSFIHYGLCSEDQRKSGQNKLVLVGSSLLVFIVSLLVLRTTFTSSGSPSSVEILASLIPIFSIMFCFYFLLKRPLRFTKEKKGNCG